MGCGASQSKVEKPGDRVDRANQRRGKRRGRGATAEGNGTFATVGAQEATPAPPPSAKPQPGDFIAPVEQGAEPPVETRAMSIEVKKATTNPNHASHVAQASAPSQSGAATPPSQTAVAPTAPVVEEPKRPQPVTGVIDTGKKVTLRQTIQMALQIAKAQREKFGKFRRDEKHGVMELYDVMGLDDDTPIAPLSEFQQQLSEYRFPPNNMHMLRDVETVDEDTVIAVLGHAEANRRKQEGMVKVVERPREDTVNGAKRRAGVSGEGTNTMASHRAFKAIPKTERQTETLRQAMKQNILFRGLDSHELRMLFDAFEQEEFPENTCIFEKGDDGDKFYLIESGRCQILLTDDDGAEKGSVSVGSGDTFGELGVMYGMPRAATIIAVLDTVTWWIDRDTYRGLLLMATLRKRDRYLAFLQKVDIFQSIDAYEKTRIADVLEVMEAPGGTIIMREGESGDNFYMIEEGTVEVSTAAKGVLSHLHAGKVFGEVALLLDRPRMATVVAKTDVRLCTLNRTNFANYLGPFEDILRRNADQYRKMMQKVESETRAGAGSSAAI